MSPCISMVSSATETATRNLKVAKVLGAIRTGGKTLKGQVTQIRNRFESELALTNGDLKAAKRAVDQLKKDLPAVTWSGTFSQRANDKLLQHSGLLCADLDGLGDKLPESRKKLEASPHVFTSFLSPTGHGLKAVFCVPADVEKHPASYRAVERHVRELTGAPVDQKCKDPARLCFMSYDPEIYVNENAREIEPLPEREKSKPVQPNGVDLLPDLQQRERIATQLLGPLKYSAEKGGYFCQCPGKATHTGSTSEKHTIVYLDKVPTLDCQHESCLNIIDAFNAKLRSQIGKAEFAPTPQSQAQTIPESGKTSEPDIPPSLEDETITRLAAFSPIEYDRLRKDEARKLRCRESTLDLLVNAKRLLMRPPSDGDNLQGVAVKLAEVEPWPEPVNGDEVLEAISERFEHYAVLPDGAADMSALWCGHTHIYKRFPISPRLHISAPTEECGKTTLRNCASLFCARAVRTENMTTAVMFRLVTGHSPTILADECDKWLFINEELLGLVQSGHGKGGTIMRCEGDSNDLRQFGCYAPIALAAIGKLPSQLHSRSICIRLERARAEEIKQRAVFDLENVEYETELNRKLARWTLDNRECIASCNPKLPEHLFNRIADNWRPLFKIAQIAGGDWPQRCARALTQLTTGEDERENLRVMLLTDIREIFTGERIFSKDLVDALVELKERPWPEILKGKPITARWLARNLSAFGIHSGNIRIGEEQAKGYERSQFDDAFERYIPKNPVLPVAQASQRPNARENPENASVPNDEVGTLEKTPVCEALGRWDGSKGGNPAKGDKVI